MFYFRKKIKPDMRRSGKERGLLSRTAAGNRAYGYLTIIPLARVGYELIGSQRGA